MQDENSRLESKLQDAVLAEKTATHKFNQLDVDYSHLSEIKEKLELQLDATLKVVSA